VKRRFRLKRATDFKRVRREGKSYAHPFVVLLVLPNELEQFRIGVTASRSVGGAVERNRAKRLLRAGIAPLLPEISTGFDLVLLARKPILKIKSHQVTAALAQNLKKADLIKDDHAS
jgi:ribonuclease P protein component